MTTNERAAGDVWKVLVEGAKTTLILKSAHGAIEVKATTLVGAELLTGIIQNYDDLKAQGPIEREVTE